MRSSVELITKIPQFVELSARALLLLKIDDYPQFPRRGLPKETTKIIVSFRREREIHSGLPVPSTLTFKSELGPHESLACDGADGIDCGGESRWEEEIVSRAGAFSLQGRGSGGSPSTSGGWERNANGSSSFSR
jgi:hypothetical protein